MLTQQEIEQFAEIYKQNFGEQLSPEQASEYSNQLVELISAVLKEP